MPKRKEKLKLSESPNVTVELSGGEPRSKTSTACMYKKLRQAD